VYVDVAQPSINLSYREKEGKHERASHFPIPAESGQAYRRGGDQRRDGKAVRLLRYLSLLTRLGDGELAHVPWSEVRVVLESSTGGGESVIANGSREIAPEMHDCEAHFVDGDGVWTQDEELLVDLLLRLHRHAGTVSVTSFESETRLDAHLLG
jgi:hypothetical protein